MGGIRGGVDAVDILNIGGVNVSGGKIPITAAGGGSNVNVTNVSGNVRAVIQGVDTAGSALNVNASFNASEIAVTAGATPLPVNIVQTSAQIHVTAGGASLPVTIQGIESAGSALRVIAIQGSETKVTGAGVPLPVSAAGVAVSGNKQAVDLPGVAIVSGAIKTTAVGAGGAAVAITNVSGQIPVTAGNSPLPVLASISGDVKVTAAGAGLPVVASMSGDVRVTAANAGLNVNLVNVSGQVQVTSPGGPLTDVCGVNRTGSALNTFIAGVSGQVKVTAGDLGLPIIASVSGDVRVTAGNLAIPVTIAAQPIAVSIAAKNAIDVSAQGAALQVTAQGGSFAVSAQGAALQVTANNPGAWMQGLRGDAVFNALVSNPVKFARFQAAGAVCADVVAAVAGRKIRVLGGSMMSTGTATAIWMTTGASAALTGKLPVINGVVWPPTQYGYFETAAGSALSIQIEGGTIGGFVTYQEVV